MRGFREIFFKLGFFLECMKTSKMFFHQLLVPNLYLSKKREIANFWKISNETVFHSLVALKITFSNAKSFIDTNICRNGFSVNPS